ncbi:MAG: hypothetical protein V1821_01915 [bacterium]
MMKKISAIILSFAFVIALAPPAQAVISSGTLIKGSLSTVYYYGGDGKRYVFPNQKTYNTWYSGFSGVTTISDAELASIMIGGNVTYKPGTRLVKITTDPRVYAIASPNTLRWVKSEAIASALYGSTWNLKVEDIPDAFFFSYRIGADINSTSDYSVQNTFENCISINQCMGLLVQ